MIGTLFFGTFLAAVLLVRARVQARQRRAQSWEELVARLEPVFNSGRLAEPVADQNDTPAQRWERVRGARGLYVMFRNANVMLEMADYAASHGSSIDRKVLAELRSDALQIRVSVVMALTQYALHHINERICANAFHAASMYTDMSARMADLLQVDGVALSPQFVGAM